MNDIPETMPWVIESFGSKDGSSDNTNIRRPASTPGFETARLRRWTTWVGAGPCIPFVGVLCRVRPSRCSLGGATVFIRDETLSASQYGVQPEGEAAHQGKPGDGQTGEDAREGKTGDAVANRDMATVCTAHLNVISTNRFGVE
jgi:hypothetical protein